MSQLLPVSTPTYTRFPVPTLCRSLMSISYSEQIVDVRRDQKATADALNALEELVRRFPDSKYARDAELKIDLTLDHLAGKHMEIGRFYQGHSEYLAAINRFRTVIERDRKSTRLNSSH